jgi:MFS family permease
LEKVESAYAQGEKRARLAEWRGAPMLPFAGTIGHAAAVFHINGFAPFIVVIAADFGWSRSITTLGLTVVLLVQALGSIPLGMLVDKFGSRRIGLIGMLSAPLGFAIIATASGGKANWVLLWLLMGVMALPVQSTVWTSAISGHFRASRGLALGVSMCGASLAGALFPWLGAELIVRFGWHRAMAYEALIWIAVAYPFTFLFFRSKRDHQTHHVARAQAAGEPGMTLKQGLRSSVYLRLLFIGALYTLVLPPMTMHFIAIEVDGGMAPIQAAKIAALIGLSSIAGRLGTGFVIDRVNAARVGALVFLLPALGCAILLAQGVNPASCRVAAVLFGLAMGAELDIFGFLTTRYFGLRNFGSLFGGILLALSLGAGIGPAVASRIFDTTGDYTAFMWLTIGCVLVCSLCFFTMPRPVLLKEARVDA